MDHRASSNSSTSSNASLTVNDKSGKLLNLMPVHDETGRPVTIASKNLPISTEKMIVTHNIRQSDLPTSTTGLTPNGVSRNIVRTLHPENVKNSTSPVPVSMKDEEYNRQRHHLGFVEGNMKQENGKYGKIEYRGVQFHDVTQEEYDQHSRQDRIRRDECEDTLFGEKRKGRPKQPAAKKAVQTESKETQDAVHKLLVSAKQQIEDSEDSKNTKKERRGRGDGGRKRRKNQEKAEKSESTQKRRQQQEEASADTSVDMANDDETSPSKKRVSSGVKRRTTEIDRLRLMDFGPMAGGTLQDLEASGALSSVPRRAALPERRNLVSPPAVERPKRTSVGRPKKRVSDEVEQDEEEDDEAAEDTSTTTIVSSTTPVPENVEQEEEVVKKRRSRSDGKPRRKKAVEEEVAEVVEPVEPVVAPVTPPPIVVKLSPAKVEQPPPPPVVAPLLMVAPSPPVVAPPVVAPPVVAPPVLAPPPPQQPPNMVPPPPQRNHPAMGRHNGYGPSPPQQQGRYPNIAPARMHNMNPVPPRTRVPFTNMGRPVILHPQQLRHMHQQHPYIQQQQQRQQHHYQQQQQRPPIMAQPFFPQQVVEDNGPMEYVTDDPPDRNVLAVVESLRPGRQVEEIEPVVEREAPPAPVVAAAAPAAPAAAPAAPAAPAQVAPAAEVIDWSYPPGCDVNYRAWTVEQMAHWVYEVSNSEKCRDIVRDEEMDGKSMEEFLNDQFRHELKIGFGPWRKLVKGATIMIERLKNR